MTPSTPITPSVEEYHLDSDVVFPYPVLNLRLESMGLFSGIAGIFLFLGLETPN